MLDKFIINILDINSVVEAPEIKIYNKEDTSKFGIKADSIIITGESKYFIDSIIEPFGITAIKILKQLLNKKDIKESGTFELKKELNQFSGKEELSILSITTPKISANIRLASESILAKIPIIKNVQYTVACVNIPVSEIVQLSKSIELLGNNDEQFYFEINDNSIYTVSGNNRSNLIKILCPFLCNAEGYESNAKFKCKDMITALKIASKFENSSININNSGVITIKCENDYIKVNINIRGEINETSSVQ